MNYRFRHYRTAEQTFFVLQVFVQVPERTRYPAPPPEKGSMVWEWVDARAEHLTENLFDSPRYELTDAGREALDGR